MDADASKTEQASGSDNSFSILIPLAEMSPVWLSILQPIQKNFLAPTQLDFSLLISKPQRETPARTIELLILAEFNDSPAPIPSSENIVIGIPCPLKWVPRGLRSSVTIKGVPESPKVEPWNENIWHTLRQNPTKKPNICDRSEKYQNCDCLLSNQKTKDNYCWTRHSWWMQPLTLKLCSNICKSICLKSKVSLFLYS